MPVSPVRFELTPEEYEDGVAEIMRQRVGAVGTVEQDVRLPSRSGGRNRQIDVLIRVAVAGMDEVLIVVECKRYGRKVHTKDVETFIGLVNDVGAARGVLVTTEGFSSGAIKRAQSEREIRIELVPVEQLPTWEPPLVGCEFCADALDPDAFPGIAYIDQEEYLNVEDGEPIATTLGYCERCVGLHIECPKCGAINAVPDMRTDEWVECEGGCALEWHLRTMAVKDDLSNPTHDRLTLRLPTTP